MLTGHSLEEPVLVSPALSIFTVSALKAPKTCLGTQSRQTTFFLNVGITTRNSSYGWMSE